MSEADDLNILLSEWVAKAEADLATAARLIDDREAWAAETICFHAQQCVEKYIKALLVLAGIDFPKTHDVRRLVDMLPEASRPDIPAAELDRLTPYATEVRYPGDFGPLGLGEAQQAVAMARRIRKHARGLLPRQALRFKKS